MALLTGVYLTSAFAFDAASSNPVDIIDIRYEGSLVNVVYQDAQGRVRLTRTTDTALQATAYTITTSA
jgi:hypothetical protein